MKIVVLGGYGNVGSGVVKLLTRDPLFERITIVGRNPAKGEKILEIVGNDPKVGFECLDIEQGERLAGLLSGYDMVMNVSMSKYHIPVLEAAEKAGVHFMSLGSFRPPQLEFDQGFKDKGLIAILGMGSCPGMSNLMAAHGIRRLDEAEEVHIRVGTKRHEVYKGFHMTPSGLVSEFIDKPLMYIDGEYKELPALSGREWYSFPEPFGGKTEGFFALHPEIFALPVSYPQLKTVTYRVGFPDEVWQIIDVLQSIGLARKDPIRVKGVDISPLEYLDAASGGFDPLGMYIEETKALQVEVRGKKDGKARSYVYTLLGSSNKKKKMIGSSFWVSVPAVIALKEYLDTYRDRTGTFTPERLFDPGPIMNKVREQGILIEEEER
jgi:saccharopine dehydrogenase-like NADP-dependent oxidoreductase